MRGMVPSKVLTISLLLDLLLVLGHMKNALQGPSGLLAALLEFFRQP
jgi:hypothetical protein